MKIITISREFGSGGRELCKRLADALHIPCYDHEIIEMVAQKFGLDIRLTSALLLGYTLYFVNFLTIQIVIIFLSMFKFTGTISFESRHIPLVYRDRVSWVLPPVPVP